MRSDRGVQRGRDEGEERPSSRAKVKMDVNEWWWTEALREGGSLTTW
jgi:hypothetical protein